MCSAILVAAVALLIGHATVGTGNVRGDMFVGQAMMRSAGSNPATTSVSPRTDPGLAPRAEPTGIRGDAANVDCAPSRGVAR